MLGESLIFTAIIPARYGSNRLPGKPLSDIHGKPMVQRVYERTTAARGIDRVLVATDDERILAAVRGFGGEAVMTRRDHVSGTDRIAEVARVDRSDAIVNVQGDEPMIDPRMIEAAMDPIREGAAMSTVSVALHADERERPSVVKVVTNAQGDALYFSRAPIPFQQVALDEEVARKHVGLYVYRRDTLLRLAASDPAPAERAEALEQLRALHNGIAIRVVRWPGEAGVAVDTPEDLEQVRLRFGDETRGATVDEGIRV